MAVFQESVTGSVENNSRSVARGDARELAPGLAILPLTIAIVITLVLTIYPLLLSTADGKADHPATLVLLWSMSAGFVRGVGFVPKNRGLRLLFSTSVCVLALVLAVAVIARPWIAQ